MTTTSEYLNRKLIAKLRLYFLMAKTIKLISTKQYQTYKSLVNAYERNWRNKHKKQHAENSKELIKSMGLIKKVVKKTKKAEKKVVQKKAKKAEVKTNGNN